MVTAPPGLPGAVAALLILVPSGCGQDPAPLLERDPRAEEACQELEYADSETLSAVEIGAALDDAVAAAKEAETPAVRAAVEGDVDLRALPEREVLRDACDDAGYRWFLE